MIHATDPTHVCLSCMSQKEPVRQRCPDCGAKSYDSDGLQRNLEDYSRGLDRGTRYRNPVAIEPETHGHYFAVVNTISREKLMCGFDSAEQAFAWCLLRGLMPVRKDADVLKILNLIDLSEKDK